MAITFSLSRDCADSSSGVGGSVHPVWDWLRDALPLIGVCALGVFAYLALLASRAHGRQIWTQIHEQIKFDVEKLRSLPQDERNGRRLKRYAKIEEELRALLIRDKILTPEKTAEMTAHPLPTTPTPPQP